MSLHVGLVTHWFDPEGGSASGPGRIARALRDHGHRVSVLTGYPHYPTGRVQSGYRVRPYEREHRDGLTVHRCAVYPSHDRQPVHRAASYLSFAASGTAVAAARVFADVDVVFVYLTPATAAMPAMALRRLRGTPYVVQIQDLWPQTVTSSGLVGSRGAQLERILHRYCDAIYRHASAVAVISPGMAEAVRARGVDPRKVCVVPNWADEQVFRPTAPDRSVAAAYGGVRAFTVMYAGNLGHYQNLTSVLSAAELLRPRADIGFVLVGTGVAEAELRRQAAHRGLDNVTFWPVQPFERMSAVLALGDVQLVSLQDEPLFRMTLPSKIQATLAAGRPILGAVTGDAAEVVRRARAGVVVAPGSAQQLADAVCTLSTAGAAHLRRMGERGRHYYLQTFSESIVSARLSAVLEAAAAPSARTTAGQSRIEATP